jgi:hypothetical protein
MKEKITQVLIKKPYWFKFKVNQNDQSANLVFSAGQKGIEMKISSNSSNLKSIHELKYNRNEFSESAIFITEPFKECLGKS